MLQGSVRSPQQKRDRALSIDRLTNLDQALSLGSCRRKQAARFPKGDAARRTSGSYRFPRGMPREEPAVHMIVIERAGPEECIEQLDSVEGATEAKVLGGRE